MLLCPENSGPELAKFAFAQVVSPMPQRKGRSGKAAPPKKDKPSRVGIVFLYENRTFVESTLVDQGEACAGFVNHTGGHEVYWERLQSAGEVPEDEPYESVPRGRVVFNQKTREYLLYLDRCIVKRAVIVRAIKAQLGLPAGSRTLILTDTHYRCSKCLDRG